VTFKLFTFTVYKLRMMINKTQSMQTRGLYWTFLYVFTVLFLICLGLCSAIAKEIIHIQRWILLLALHLYHTCADSVMLW